MLAHQLKGKIPWKLNHFKLNVLCSEIRFLGSIVIGLLDTDIVIPYMYAFMSKLIYIYIYSYKYFDERTKWLYIINCAFITYLT